MPVESTTPFERVTRVRDLLELLLGGRVMTTTQEKVIAVGTAATQLCPFDARRVRIEFYYNTSVGAVFVSSKPDMTVADGQDIGFATTALFRDWLTDFEGPTDALYAIGAGAGNTIYVRETLLT
jgi:hypothetical protein